MRATFAQFATDVRRERQLEGIASVDADPRRGRRICRPQTERGPRGGAAHVSKRLDPLDHRALDQ
jgi:hypothetical protein